MMYAVSFFSDLMTTRLSSVPSNKRSMIPVGGVDMVLRVSVTRWWMLTCCSSVTEHGAAARAVRIWAGKSKNTSYPTPPRRDVVHIIACGVHQEWPWRRPNASYMTWSGLWCDVSDHSERPGRARLFVSSKDCENDGQTRTERDGVIAVISASDIDQLVGGDATRPYQTSGGEKAHGRSCGCAEERREGGFPLLNLLYMRHSTVYS